ncbi:hypothetical protein B4109_2316 [Geobacillus stearothermophilus]|uniref:Uncharacterized protein n=1 Tax=Geobacillus stearothermophilus TaxID=1422 RepID=A0A150MFZ5_GEOSE|nr:hypothetical protein B4109_2316 [Geobacillus stearothermophilus]
MQQAFLIFRMPKGKSAHTATRADRTLCASFHDCEIGRKTA